MMEDLKPLAIRNAAWVRSFGTDYTYADLRAALIDGNGGIDYHYLRPTLEEIRRFAGLQQELSELGRA